MCSNTIHVPTHPLQRNLSLHCALPLPPAINPPRQPPIPLRIPPHLPPDPLLGQERLLPRAQDAVPLALPLALDVPGRDVLDGAVVPDGDVAGRLPADAGLDVVVPRDEVLDHGEEAAALVVGDAHEAAAVHAAGEEGVPARDRVRADGRVHGVEAEADVGGGAARARVGALGAASLGVVRVAPLDAEAREEALEGLAQAVVEVVRAGVEGVAARGGDLAQAEGGVVAGVLFERHVAVPLVRGGLALLGVGLVAVALGDALRDQRDDFGVVAVERVERVGHDVVLGGAAGGGGDAVDDFLVAFVVEVLVTEHGDTTLGNCHAPESEAIGALSGY